VTAVGKIGWGSVYAAQVLIAAPAVAGTAVVAVGFWVEEAVRKATGAPVRWQMDDRDEERVSRQLAHFTADPNRVPARSTVAATPVA
jgi:hypothetical protein